jgi:hypothetical protein
MLLQDCCQMIPSTQSLRLRREGAGISEAMIQRRRILAPGCVFLTGKRAPDVECGCGITGKAIYKWQPQSLSMSMLPVTG